MKILICVLLIWPFAEGKIRYLPKVVPAVAQANNDFAFALHKSLANENNVLFSPWSITFTLGMLLLGAEGKTYQEMKKVMFLEQLEGDDIHYGVKQLREHLMRYDTEYEMSMFSTIFVQQLLLISPVYKLKLQRYYDTDIQDVDFAGQGNLVMELVNVWTALKTSGKIKNILTTAPTEDTVMLLLTANYFKGKWEDTFNPNETKPRKFHNADGSKTEMKMMFATRNMSIYSGDSFAVDAVYLPMKGDVSFVFIKPENSRDMAILEKNISSEFFQELFDDFSEEPVELGLPKFKVSSRIELQDYLQAMGMKRLFSPSDAELTGISATGLLSADKVIHKAALDIDEDGATVGAVTVGSIVSRTKTYKMHFDSPFLFVIRDTRSSVILFMGRISNL